MRLHLLNIHSCYTFDDNSYIIFYFIYFSVVLLSSILWIWIEMEFDRREKHTDFHGFSILHQSVTIVLDYNLDRYTRSENNYQLLFIYHWHIGISPNGGIYE